MRIRSLEISGFKSFAERVVLALEPGVSAIVGPNGCGKSNVVDAIRWVMGEHNPRHLRGREMDDLIFAGTDSKPAVGMAEVILKLDTSDGRVPPEYARYPEIQIARRLYRDGESEYLINRVPVRRRDVTDFFLDTGVGTRGYTIVEQGHIATIVSTKPEERRTILEEAAGIGKYRARRRESESKLRSTEANLLRVNDVLGELRRQIGSLDRQARKAARYRELSGKARELELCVARQELDGHAGHLASAESELADLRAESLAIDARVSGAESRLEAQRRLHLDRERALTAESERLFELRSEIKDLESRISYERREGSGLEELASQREAEGTELETRLQERDARLREAIGALAFAQDRVERDRAELEGREAALRELTQRRSERSGRREAARTRLEELGAERATLESRSELLEERRPELEQRLRQQDEALDGAIVDVESMGTEEGSLETRLRDALSERDSVGLRLAEALREQGEAQSELEAVRPRRVAAHEELERAAARLESLRETEQQEALRAAEVLDRLPDAERARVRGRLADVIRVEDGLERALEAALSSRLDSLLVADSASALGLLSWLRTGGAGRVTVFASQDEHAQPASGLVPLGRPLLEVVSAKPPHEPLVRRLLQGVYLVDDLGEAVERYGLESPPAVFVTARGEILDRSGALTGGEGAAPGVLTRSGEIRRLEARIGPLEQARSAADALEQRLGGRLGELEHEVENARSRHHTAELAVLYVEKDLERARERAKGAAELADELRTARSSLGSELERLGAERERLEARLGDLAGERSAAERDSTDLAAEIAEVSRELEREEQRVVQQRVDLAQLSERRDQLGATRDDLAAAVDEDRTRLERLRAEVEGARERAASLARSVAEAETQLGERIRREESLRARQEELREAYASQLRDMEAIERDAREAQRERDEARERLSAAELSLQELRMRSDALSERVRERYQIDLAAFEIPGERRGEDPEGWRRDLAALQQGLAALGDVHLGAIEEYEEVSERFRYLTEQQEDLRLSVERLRNAITRINRTSRARFRETFEAVNTEFKELFPKLFRGGRAHLQLTEAEDVLEAGIDIHAQPPGKRLQNVNLLSGGEKSLTAIALLFSVFKVKPSPFFMLDEVDAALDDANVGRFNELVTDMAEGSQFILITHNKGTIEIARTLFGVTMETPGESKLVTVDLVQ